MEKISENEIIRDFKSDLKNCIAKTRKSIEQHQENIKNLQKEIDSKVYSSEIIQKLEDKIRAEERNIRGGWTNCIDSFRDDATKIIEKYAEFARNLDVVDGSEITDDAKLLNSGINLNERDIEAIAERSKGNQTMGRMLFEYCQTHNFKVPEVTLLDYGSGSRTAEEIEGCKSGIHYFSKWIDKPQYADDMLHKMLPYLFEEE